jgi:poly[ADP-ribose] polymerase 16
MENTEVREQKLFEIKEIIQRDINGSDLKLSLFISAAQSFKKNFLATPFPSNYVDGENKDFERLVSL